MNNDNSNEKTDMKPATRTVGVCRTEAEWLELEWESPKSDPVPAVASHPKIEKVPAP